MKDKKFLTYFKIPIYFFDCIVVKHFYANTHLKFVFLTSFLGRPRPVSYRIGSTNSAQV